MKIAKQFLLLLLMNSFSANVFSQTPAAKVSEKDWNKLIQFLTNENWEKAEKLSSSYLNRFSAKEDTIDDVAILRYMYLSCIAARVGNKEYDKKVGIAKTKNLIGKDILTPPKEFNQKKLFNSFQISENKKDISSCSANNIMTEIHMFETYKLKNASLIGLLSNYETKSFRIKAKIKTIDAGGFAMPRLEVVFDNATIWDVE